ncbi:LVIVD repeat-containing protein [Natrialbaceae archaeon A-arb3/5]
MYRRALLQTSAVAAVPLAGSCLGGSSSPSTDDSNDGQDAYDPLGEVAVPGAAEAVVGDDGDIAYLAATTGFATVDVSDLAEPTVLAEERDLAFDGRPMTEILDVKVDGDVLVVAGPANRSPGDEFNGFVCYDVSDPAEPERLTEPFETGFHIHNCYLDGEMLYVVENQVDENPLVVYDVGEDDPAEIGRWSLLEHEPGWRDVNWLARYLHDVYVHDDVAYLAHWNAGTYLLDVSDPTEPEHLGRVIDTDLEAQREIEDDTEAVQGLPGNDHYAAVDETGDLLAVGREAWATGGSEPDGPGGIDLYDASDPTEPEHRATIDAPRASDERYNGPLWTTAHNFELRDGELYASWYQGGVTIHDVSDPAEPVELASWRDPETAGFWTARVADPGETFVASSTPVIPHGMTDGALYTFPIRAGEQDDQPPLDAEELGLD